MTKETVGKEFKPEKLMEVVKEVKGEDIRIKEEKESKCPMRNSNARFP